MVPLLCLFSFDTNFDKFPNYKPVGIKNRNISECLLLELKLQSPNQKIPDRKTKCVIKTHINIKQNVIFGAKLKPV